MRQLSVSLATRGRPLLLQRMLETTLKNTSLPNTTILLAVDEDDKATLDSLPLLPKDSRLKVSVRPREDSRGEKYDRVLTEAPASLYLLATDYGAITTPGYDNLLLDAVVWPDGIGVVYTEMCDELVPFLQAPTDKLVEKVGYTYNHDYPFWFIDHELADIGQMIGRINFASVKVDVSTRPGNTIRCRDLEFWASYYDFMVLERRNIARKIIRSPEFQAPEWFKTQLCNWYPLTEFRSFWRNGRVRDGVKNGGSGRDDPGEPDAGYVRAKEKAVKKADKLFTALRAAA